MEETIRNGSNWKKRMNGWKKEEKKTGKEMNRKGYEWMNMNEWMDYIFQQRESEWRASDEWNDEKKERKKTKI